MEYERFEEEIAQRSADIERAVHEVALSGLDVDAPFVCVWGKTYRRVPLVACSEFDRLGVNRVHRRAVLAGQRDHAAPLPTVAVAPLYGSVTIKVGPSLLVPHATMVSVA